MANINLDYGKQTLKIDVPDSNLQELCSIKDKPGVSDVEAEILRAISNPIGGSRIDQMAKPGAKAVLLVDDYLRKTPASIILPIVVNELSKAGVKDSDIEIIVARGTHPKMNEEKRRAKVGDVMYDRFKVSNHDCDDPDQLELYGLSSRGTNIQLNKKVHSADVVIGIGGSTLGTYAIYKFLKHSKTLAKQLYFLETTDPIDIKAKIDAIDLEDTLFIVISKSGTTIETDTEETGPTSVGMPSEASTATVITNEKEHRKLSAISNLLRPKFAIMNPELTFTLIHLVDPLKKDFPSLM